MPQGLTETEYAQRKADLARAIDFAEGEVHSITFKQTTGTAKPAEVQAAKDHLAKVKEQARDLENAWFGAQTAAREAHQGERKAWFDTYLASVDEELENRESAIQTVQRGAELISNGVLAYRAASAAIRLGAKDHHGNAGNASIDLQHGLNAALGFDVAGAIVAAVCSKLGIVPEGQWHDSFFGKSAEEYEALRAAKIRTAAELFAPKFEDAV